MRQPGDSGRLTASAARASRRVNTGPADSAKAGCVHFNLGDNCAASGTMFVRFESIGPACGATDERSCADGGKRIVCAKMLYSTMHQPRHQHHKRDQGHHAGSWAYSNQKIVRTVKEGGDEKPLENRQEFSLPPKARHTHGIAPHGREHYMGRRSEYCPEKQNARPEEGHINHIFDRGEAKGCRNGVDQTISRLLEIAAPINRNPNSEELEELFNRRDQEEACFGRLKEGFLFHPRVRQVLQ